MSFFVMVAFLCGISPSFSMDNIYDSISLAQTKFYGIDDVKNSDSNFEKDVPNKLLKDLSAPFCFSVNWDVASGVVDDSYKNFLRKVDFFLNGLRIDLSNDCAYEYEKNLQREYPEKEYIYVRIACAFWDKMKNDLNGSRALYQKSYAESSGRERASLRASKDNAFSKFDTISSISNTLDEEAFCGFLSDVFSLFDGIFNIRCIEN